MALKTFVKISGINNLTDARYCAGMAVNVLGFNFEENDPNYMDPDKYTAITEWLSGVAYCAEFENSTAEEIQETLRNYPEVDYLQIQHPNYLPALQLLQKPIILKLDARLLDDTAELEDSLKKTVGDVAYFLLEGDETVERSLVNDALNLASQYPILLGFGLQQDNVMALLEKSRLKGIALRGGNEIKPGYKDFDDLADILEAIEVDDVE